MKTLIALVLITGLGLFTSPQARAQTNVSGNFTLTADIYVHTAIPSGDVLFCELTITTAGESDGTVNSEDVIVQATLKSGSTWTCAPQIFYYWHLTSPTTDVVTITWGLAIGPSSATAKQQLVRSGTHILPAITGVPPSGTSWGRNDDAAL